MTVKQPPNVDAECDQQHQKRKQESCGTTLCVNEHCSWKH